MKKRLMSLLLSCVMVLGLCAPALAVEDTGQTTKVSLDGTGTDTYTLTVPASMAPGSSDTVTLSGTWPSNKTYTITVDNTVVLKNDIDTSESVSANVSIETLSLAGNNKTSVSATANVSVGQIPDVLFGNWVGNFKYYVGSTKQEIVEYRVPTMTSGYNWYKSTESASTITSIQMIDSYTPTGNEDETWFADKDNGTVPETQITVYRTGTEIIITGNGTGEIIAGDCNRMFSYSINGYFSNLAFLDISILNTSDTTDMSSMFSGCQNLTSLDLSSFATSNVVYMDLMFENCRNLTTIYVGSGWNTDAVTDDDAMFDGCTSLPNYGPVDKTNAHTGEGGYLTLKT